MASSAASRPDVVGPRAGQRARRTFTSAYKMRIVAEYDSLTEHGSRGALLRREGLYDSHINKWRRAQAQKNADGATVSSAASSGVTDDAQVRRLKRENARLASELARTKAVVEVLGKTYALLEILSESADPTTT